MKNIKLKSLALLIGLTGLGFADTFPVGTVINSILEEEDFQTEMGTAWVLMDGRPISKTDELSAYLDGNSNCILNTTTTCIPDARGMFLRMLNNGRTDGQEDPEENRTLGSEQSDEFKSHSHDYGDMYYAESNGPISKFGRLAGSNKGADGDNYAWQVERVTDNNGTKETRPKNIAVNFFIKIKKCKTTECK